jgi:hypothetical protein
VNINRFVKEPLVHFLLLGAALFFLFGWVNRGDTEAPDEIVVDEALLTHLVSRFERTWQRPPTEDEFNALVESWVREEVLYREGLDMGMDVDDPIVRRRIAQKVEIFSETLAPYATTDEELETWLADNMDIYRVPPKFTFRQVFFDPGRHGDEVDAVIAAARATLESDPGAFVGDATMLPAREQNVDGSQVARAFGMEFAAALEAAETGAWVGPLRSGFGLHLVYVEAREEGREPALDEVRSAVERDFIAERINDTRDAFYEALRQRYTVRVEREAAEAGGQ